MTALLLETERLCAGYGTTTVVRDVGLSVQPGQVVVLLGANGAGKTTTLLTLSGDHPAQAGTVRVFGEVTTAPLHRRAQLGLALVPEERTVFTSLSVQDNLRVARSDQARATSIFPELEALLARKAGLLSGGEQQMLTMGRALGRSPRLLLVDELSFGLAPMVIGRLLRAIREAANEGVGVLLVEQQARQAVAIADRVLVMRRGRIVMDESAETVRNDFSSLEALYLSG